VTARSVGVGALGALLALTAGCIDTDPAVFVEATVVDPAVTLTQGTLVSTVAGSFTLALHLGPRAADAAQVSLGVLSLASSDRTTTFVPTLAVHTAPSFPVTVEVDGDVPIAVSFDAQDNQLETATYDAICAAGSVVITGAFDDSLRGATSLIGSQVITPSGCP
jgi:hypothetical protein